MTMWLCLSRFEPSCLKLVFVIISLKRESCCTAPDSSASPEKPGDTWRCSRKGKKEVWYHCLDQWSNSRAISLLHYNRLQRRSEMLGSNEKTFCSEHVSTPSRVLPCAACACTHTYTCLHAQDTEGGPFFLTSTANHRFAAGGESDTQVFVTIYSVSRVYFLSIFYFCFHACSL